MSEIDLIFFDFLEFYRDSYKKKIINLNRLEIYAYIFTDKRTRKKTLLICHIFSYMRLTNYENFPTAIEQNVNKCTQ